MLFFIAVVLFFLVGFFARNSEKLFSLLTRKSAFDLVCEGGFLRRVIRMMIAFLTLATTKPSSSVVKNFFLGQMTPEFRGRFFGRGLTSLILPSKPLSVSETRKFIGTPPRILRPNINFGSPTFQEMLATFPLVGIALAAVATAAALSTEEDYTKEADIELRDSVKIRRSLLVMNPIMLNKWSLLCN
jgi:hypothetical protein